MEIHESIIRQLVPSNYKKDITVNKREKVGYEVASSEKGLTIAIGRIAGDSLVYLQKDLGVACEQDGLYRRIPATKELNSGAIQLSLDLVQALRPADLEGVLGWEQHDIDPFDKTCRRWAKVICYDQLIQLKSTVYVGSDELHGIAKHLWTAVPANPQQTILDIDSFPKRPVAYVDSGPKHLHLILAATVIFALGIGTGMYVARAFRPSR